MPSIDSLVKVYATDVLIKDAFEDFMTGTEKQCYHPEVLLCIDSVKGVQIVTIEVNNKDRVINKDLYDVSANKQKYLKYNDFDYYSVDEKIFTHRYSNVDITIKSSKTEVKNKNGKLKFDKHYQEPPTKIKEWCSKNLTENGSFIIRYTNCNNRYTATKTKIQ